MSKTPEELQADLEKALTSIEKLTAKNSELIDREKKAKSAAEAAQEAADAAAEEAARKGNDLEALEKSLSKKYEKQIADLTASNQTATKQLETLLIDNTIQSALNESRVPPQFQRPLIAMIKSEAALKDGAAFAGDVPLNDFIKDYLSSDHGKHFVSAPQNTGAGAQGSTSTTIKTSGEWNLTRYTEMKNNNPAEAAAYAEQHGKKF